MKFTQPLPTLFLLLTTWSLNAQIATIDISSPTNPVVTYDSNPQISAPDIPENPTAIYMNALEIPGGTDTYSLEHAALVNEGMVVSMVNLEIGDYTAQAPAVITSEPDTYSLSPASVYYTAPTNDPPPVVSTNSGPFYFDFGMPSSAVAPGYTGISERSAYDASLGYGWGNTNRVSSRDRGVKNDPLGSDFCMPAGTPFYIDLTNGSYTVTVLTGDTTQKSSMSVRANGLPEISPGAPTGQYLQQSFPVTITNGRLRLEFFGSICHVNAITIERVPDNAPHKPTVFVASDSTAAAYSRFQYPLTGWGDRLSYFLTDDVIIDDLAQAGRSSKSFIEEGWLDTIVNRIRTNDYLFVMMAINDSASTGNRKTDPATTFKAYLRLYVNAARSHGAIPVFVTSQTKRTFDIWGRFFNSVGGYPQAMRDFGRELNVPVIDLNQKSIAYFTQVGPNETTNLFMYFPPGMYPAWPNGDADYIHFQDRGATALAKLVIDGARELALPRLAEFALTNPPAAPAAPVATTVSSSQIDLTWVSTPTARAYNIKRATTSGGPYTTIGNTGSGTSFTDSNLAPGTTYFYVVSAINGIGESVNSAEAHATTLTGPSAIPSGLRAAAGYSKVTLTWNTSPGATSYNIKRSTVNGGPYTTIANTATATCSDTNVVNYSTYYYVVSSVNSYAESADSDPVSATPLDLLGYWQFDETSGTMAADSVGAHNGTLNGGASWTTGRLNNAVQLDGTNGYVALPAGLVSSLNDFSISTWVRVDRLATWERVFDFGSGTGVYMFLSPNSADGTVRYAITTGSGGAEQQINSASTLTTSIWHHVVVTLSGNTGILYIDGQEAGRNSSMTLKPSSLGATTQNYLGKSQWPDPYLPGAIDDFRIYARALSGPEVVSLAAGNPSAAPFVPTGLIANAGYRQISLTWNSATGATSYNVKRATVSGGPYTTVATALNTTSCLDAGLNDGTTYYYVVSAANNGGESANSTEASATTAPGGLIYGGRATALKATILGAAEAWSDTGALPPSGGARESSQLTVNEPDLLAGDVGHASVIGQGDRTRAEASLANVSMNLGGVSIQADFAMSRAMAIWQPTGIVVSGTSQLANLFIAGQPVVISGQPNQIVPLLNGSVIINEQTGTSNSITVNALRVIINGAADVVVGSSQASLGVITTPQCNGSDYITGGGWITGTPSGARGNFAVEGGVTNGVCWGHLNFKDQGTGMSVKATTITVYQTGSTPNARHIEGTAAINGSDGFTFSADATDNGEPGTVDAFTLDLSNGYRASGTLGGGNIQLNSPCQ
jgi:fibronectin type 3 domain-containing protein/lysophospholipase L1-like esterase